MRFLTGFFVEPYNWIKVSLVRPAAFRAEEEPTFSDYIRRVFRLGIFVYLFCALSGGLLLWALYSLFPNLVPTAYRNLFLSPARYWNEPVGREFLTNLLVRTGAGALIGIIIALLTYGGATHRKLDTLIVSLASGFALGLLAGSTIGAKNNLVLGALGGTIAGLIGGGLIFAFSYIYTNAKKGEVSPSGGFATAVGIMPGLSYAYILGLGFENSSMSVAVIGLTLGLCLGLPLGQSFGDILKFLGIMLVSLFSAAAVGLLVEFAYIQTLLGLTGGVAFGLGFLVAGLVGLVKLPLYPFSCFSQYRAYAKSRNTPATIFENLEKSPVHQHEMIYLPLPALESTLVLAGEHDQEKTLVELYYIAAHQPWQLGAARRVFQKLIFDELQLRDSLLDISTFSEWVALNISDTSSLLDQNWRPGLFELEQISREVKKYLINRSLNFRQNTLAKLKEQLYRLQIVKNPKDSFQTNLAKVASHWMAVIRREAEKLEGQTKAYFNPYIPGGLLETSHPGSENLFVGRLDVARSITASLNNPYGRSALLLYGERRMGKTSILKQMENLLNARYIPVFLDIQNVSTRASLSTFFIILAEEIQSAMLKARLSVNKLDQVKLKAAEATENPDNIFEIIRLWLAGLEAVLEATDRVVLLMLDEYEKLNDISKTDYAKFNLLMDWMRHVGQHNPRVSFLFAGVKTFGELGSGWVRTFVDARSVKVGFLQPEEARPLILHPVPDFDGERIFPPEVVQAIIDITACQPMLLQATCFELVNILESNNKARADMELFQKAASQVLSSFDTYFRDLWDRSNSLEQHYLKLMQLNGSFDRLEDPKKYGNVSISSGQSQQIFDRLERRDLIKDLNSRSYKISMPLFETWIARNNP